MRNEYLEERFLESVWQLALSVGMSIAPVYADSISILDEITDEETTEDYAEDTSTILARSSYLNFGNVKITKSMPVMRL